MSETLSDTIFSHVHLTSQQVEQLFENLLAKIGNSKILTTRAGQYMPCNIAEFPNFSVSDSNSFHCSLLVELARVYPVTYKSIAKKRGLQFCIDTNKTSIADFNESINRWNRFHEDQKLDQVEEIKQPSQKKRKLSTNKEKKASTLVETLEKRRIEADTKWIREGIKVLTELIESQEKELVFINSQ